MRASTPPRGVYTRDTFPQGRWGAPVRLTCDAVVVGSGAGGAVVAAELAEAGFDVVVLEEGGYHGTEEFGPDTLRSAGMLYRDGGATVSLGEPSIQYAEGRCVGGSTTINGGMSWPTPEKILDRWQREEGVVGASPKEMERYFARVEKFISARHQDPETIGRDNEILKLGADRLGWRCIPNVRNQVHCAGCNNCAFGCPTGAKQSTLVSYIPRALHFGARVFADCRADRILLKRGRAVGIAGHVVKANGAAGRAFVVDARLVVAACGSIETPALLVRSGVKSPSGRIGHNLSLHPNGKLVAIFDDVVEGWKGVHQAYQVREFEDEGLVMAAVNVTPAALAMSLPQYGPALGRILDEYDKTVIAGFLCEDTTTGRVRVVGGRPLAFYDVSDRDAERLVRGIGLLSELLFAAGARRIVAPLLGMADFHSVDDLRQLDARPVRKHALDLMTVHLMGTAAMGGDERKHVCDSFGKVYGTTGLYVADASLFPTPIGVNPMETIMGLATRNAEHLIETTAVGRRAA
jgi:choline dehydrogenase-like flavoprotein